MNLPLPEPSESASAINRKIAALRQLLNTDPSTWPQFANTLLDDLTASSDKKEDDAMLVYIVEDALRGADLPRKYPELYRRLLSDSSLRHTFLDMLAALDPNQPIEMPPMPKLDLSFLATAVSPQPTVHTSKFGWQATWQLLSDHLDKCFPDPLSLAYRTSYDDLLEDQAIVLLEDVLDIDGRQLNVLLEAILDVDAPDAPTLSLSVASFSGEPLPRLQATLIWGDYQATAVLNHYGIAWFPSLAITSVLDNSQQTIGDDLQLVLETISP
jgi:hypothetical protein